MFEITTEAAIFFLLVAGIFGAVIGGLVMAAVDQKQFGEQLEQLANDIDDMLRDSQAPAAQASALYDQDKDPGQTDPQSF